MRRSQPDEEEPAGGGEASRIRTSQPDEEPGGCQTPPNLGGVWPRRQTPPKLGGVCHVPSFSNPANRIKLRRLLLLVIYS